MADHKAILIVGLACAAACTGTRIGNPVKDGTITGGARATGSGVRGCPGPDNQAEISFGCVTVKLPAVKATGPCSASGIDAGTGVLVQSNDAGTCHVDVTFGSGAMSSVDVNFVARWRALGDDPHGCGLEFRAVNNDGSPCGSSCGFFAPSPDCNARIDELDGGT